MVRTAWKMFAPADSAENQLVANAGKIALENVLKHQRH